jgi:hypothetical protein
MTTVKRTQCPNGHGELSIYCAEVADAQTGEKIGDIPILAVCDDCGHKEDARVPEMFADGLEQARYI